MMNEAEKRIKEPLVSEEHTEETEDEEIESVKSGDKKRAAEEVELDDDSEPEQEEGSEAEKPAEGDEGSKSEEKEEESSEEEDENYILDHNRFPDKVHWLLEENAAPGAIWWLPEGDALAVNRDAFSMQLLIRHFRGNKFSSVTRNFNRWGFRRVPDERVPDGVLGYAHDKFLRGRPGLLKKMKKEVYVKKEKDEKEGGSDKKRPKKKPRTKTTPRKAAPAMERLGPGQLAVHRASLDLQNRLSSNLGVPTAAMAQRGVFPHDASRRSSLLRMHEQPNDPAMASSATSLAVARRMAILRGGPGREHLSSAEATMQHSYSMSADPSRRLSAMQETFPTGDAARLPVPAGMDQLVSAQTRRLAALQAASSGQTLTRADSMLTMLATSRGQPALSPISRAALLPNPQHAGLQHGAYGQLAGHLSFERSNQDLLQTIARQRQLDAQHLNMSLSFPQRGSASSLDMSDPVVLQMLSAQNPVYDQLLSSPSLGQDPRLGRRSSQQLGVSQLRATLTDASTATDRLMEQQPRWRFRDALHPDEQSLHEQLIVQRPSGGVHPRAGQLLTAQDQMVQGVLDDVALRRDQMERREEAKRGL